LNKFDYVGVKGKGPQKVEGKGGGVPAEPNLTCWVSKKGKGLRGKKVEGGKREIKTVLYKYPRGRAR